MNTKEFIKNAKKYFGSISAIADLLNVNRTTIYNWIKRDNIPTSKKVEIIKEIANIERILKDGKS